MARPRRNSFRVASPHAEYVEELIRKSEKVAGIPVVEIKGKGSARYLGSVANKSNGHLRLSDTKQRGGNETLLMLTGNMRIVEKCRNGTWFEIV